MADVEILGLRELIKASDKIQREFPNELGKAAADVARATVRGAQGNTNTRQQSAAAQSLTASNDGEAGTVSGGVPFFAGAEFGGQGRPETMQFPPHRGQRGYFLYPWMRANSSRLDDIWQAGIDEAMKPWHHNPRGGA